MKKTLMIAVLAVAAAGVNAQEATQETRFLQLSLTPGIAIQPRTMTIKGVSLGIWGENPQRGLTLGFVNGSTGESSGFSWGLIANYADSYTGVAWGLVNVSKENFVGWQDGFFNYSRGTFTGVQSAFGNIAENFKGLQFGLLNYADNLQGVQLGVVNVAMNNPWFSEFPNKLATGFPIFNWSF